MYVGDRSARRTIRTFERDRYHAQAWEFGERSGTHMDAPATFLPGDRLTPSCIPRSCSPPGGGDRHRPPRRRDPDAQVGLRDLRAYERRHDRIPRHAAVFMYSGWEQRVGDPDAYRNPEPDGRFHFPGSARRRWSGCWSAATSGRSASTPSA